MNDQNARQHTHGGVCVGVCLCEFRWKYRYEVVALITILLSREKGYGRKRDCGVEYSTACIKSLVPGLGVWEGCWEEGRGETSF